MGVRDLYVNPSAEDEGVGYLRTRGDPRRARAAGSRDLFGAPIEYTGELRHPRGLVASNGRVHDEVDREDRAVVRAPSPNA